MSDLVKGVLGYLAYSVGVVGVLLSASHWVVVGWLLMVVFGVLTFSYQSGKAGRRNKIDREISALIMDGQAQMNLPSLRHHLQDKGLL